MATQLFFRSSALALDWPRGQGDADQQGTTQNWTPLPLATSRGAGVTSATRTSIAGPVTGPTAGTNLEWISEPLDAGTTISGTVTFNLWGNQAANANNTGLGCIVQRLDSQGAVISTIVGNSEIGVELPNTTPAVRNETASPTSTNMPKGDRLRIRVYFNDAVTVTMGPGGALAFTYNGTTGGVSGDSYVTFTENFGFLAGFTGTTLVTQDTSDSNLADILGGSGTEEMYAQGFTLAPDTVVAAADLYLVKANAPTDNLVLDVVSTLSRTSLATSSVASSALTSAAYNTFTFTSQAFLPAGSYFLQLSRSGVRSGTNYWTWNNQSTDVYAGGSQWARSSAVWTESSSGTRDLRFKLYGDDSVTALYLADTAAEVDPNGASYDAKEAWTSRGGGVETKLTSPVTGPTAPLLAKDESGAGNFIEWFTKSLTAFTLSGLVSVNIRAWEFSAAINGAVRVEIAVCATDGTSPVIWGAANDGVELGTSEAAMAFNVAGDDTAVTNGQRLRIRIYFDDAPGLAMANPAASFRLVYAGTSVGASGDTYITLPQTVTEYSAAVTNALQLVGGRGRAESIYPTATG